MNAGLDGGTRPARGVTRRPPSVTPPGVTPGTVGKAALCEALGWTRPRLDRRLNSDGAFPVAKRGDRSGGWEFVLADVQAYLAGGAPAVKAPAPGRRPRAATPAPVAVEDAALSAPSPVAAALAPIPAARDRTFTPPAEHAGEQTARQRRDWLQAEILEDKLRRDRGELVAAEDMRRVMTTMLAHLGKGLDRVPDMVVELLGLPEDDSERIRTVIDDLRKGMVDELRGLLGGD